MRPASKPNAARYRWAVGVAATLAVMALGHAAHGGDPEDAFTTGDRVILPAETKLHIRRQVVETGPFHRRLTIERIQAGWLWVVDDEVRGWIRRGDAPPPLPWVETQVVLKSLETRLRVGRMALDTRRNHRVLTVKQVRGDWLWVVGDGLSGWVKKNDVIEESEAVAYFTRLVREDPRSARARYLRGVGLDRRGKIDEAIADHDEAIRLDPHFAAAYRSRAAVRMGRKTADEDDRERALADLNEAIRLDPGDPEAHYWRAAFHALDDDTDHAIAELTEALRLEPSVHAFYQRAKCWNEEGDHARAVADFEEAIRLAKQGDADSHLLTRLYFGSGCARRDQGDRDRAIADYTEVIRLAPPLLPILTAMALNNRGVLWHEKGEDDRALADFTKVVAGDAPGRDAATELLTRFLPDLATQTEAPVIVQCYLNRSLLWTDRGDKVRALADCEEAIRLGPDLDFSYVVRGTIRDAFADHEAALADFQRAIRMDPEGPWGHACLAWLRATCPRAKLRDGKEAVAAATRACALTRWDDVNCLVGLAAAKAEAGDFDAAFTWQSKALGFLSGTAAREGREMLDLYYRKTPFRVLPDDRKSRPARLGVPDLLRTAG